MEGAPKFAESQTLPSVDYASWAASLGLQAIAVDKPGEIGPAWDRRWARTGRRCWMCAATRTCRRSRRTPRSSRCRTRARRSSMAMRIAGASSRKASRRRSRSSCRTPGSEPPLRQRRSPGLARGLPAAPEALESSPAALPGAHEDRALGGRPWLMQRYQRDLAGPRFSEPR